MGRKISSKKRKENAEGSVTLHPATFSLAPLVTLCEVESLLSHTSVMRDGDFVCESRVKVSQRVSEFTSEA